MTSFKSDTWLIQECDWVLKEQRVLLTLIGQGHLKGGEGL